MRKVLFVLALTAALAAGQPGLRGQAWSLLTTVWEHEGFGMDPSGDPNPTPQTDAGFGMDPNGKPGS